jgi:hypothetical protein
MKVVKRFRLSQKNLEKLSENLRKSIGKRGRFEALSTSIFKLAKFALFFAVPLPFFMTPFGLREGECPN